MLKGSWVPKSGNSKKSSSKSKRSRRTEESTGEVVDITKSESDEVEPPSKQIQDKKTDTMAQTKDDFSPVVKLGRVGSTSGGVDMPEPGYQSVDVMCITDEETRTTAENLESFREAEDPAVIDGTRTPPGEAAHFEGTSLMDNIRNSAKRQKKFCSHLIMQQMAVNTPASSITAVPIQHVPWAKVVTEDLINLQSRRGSPNALVVAASDTGRRMMSQSTSSNGKGETTSEKNEPWPPLESRALADITGSTGGGNGGAAGGDGEEPHNSKPGTSELTLIISKESEFADDPHQVIPTEDCYGLPLIQRQCGGFERDYQSLAEVEEF